MKHSIDKPILSTTGLVGFTAGLVGLTSCIGLVLVGSSVSADDVVDDVSITVPVSCTMSGSGMNSHTAEIANGTYTPNIGTTTINVLCNDNGGFSIYATGYTGETIGQTNSNKLVGTSASGNSTIATGTATSAGNPDVSNWAMKLATNSQATYPISITTDYDAYHAVPNEYTKVATRLQGTDVGTGATGASLTTTYAAYISKTQVADTYSGKVKYTLVHPNTETPPTPGVYTINSYPSTQIGEPIPEGVLIHNTPGEAIASWIEEQGASRDIQIFLKHTVVNNIITESYAGFAITPEMAEAIDGLVSGMYYLRGGIDESSLQNKEVFVANMNIMKTAFDYSNHPDRCSGGVEDGYFSCSANDPVSNDSSPNAAIYDYGNTDTGDYYWCAVNGDGSSSCDYQ